MAGRPRKLKSDTDDGQMPHKDFHVIDVKTGEKIDSFDTRGQARDYCVHLACRAGIKARVKFIDTMKG